MNELNQLIEILKNTASPIFHSYLATVIFHSWLEIIFSSIVILIAILIISCGISMLFNDSDAGVQTIVLSFVLLIPCLYWLLSGINGLKNPTYYATENIIQSLNTIHHY